MVLNSFPKLSKCKLPIVKYINIEYENIVFILIFLTIHTIMYRLIYLFMTTRLHVIIRYANAGPKNITFLLFKPVKTVPKIAEFDGL